MNLKQNITVIPIKLNIYTSTCTTCTSHTAASPIHLRNKVTFLLSHLVPSVASLYTNKPGQTYSL